MLGTNAKKIIVALTVIGAITLTGCSDKKNNQQVASTQQQAKSSETQKVGLKVTKSELESRYNKLVSDRIAELQESLKKNSPNSLPYKTAEIGLQAISPIKFESDSTASNSNYGYIDVTVGDDGESITEAIVKIAKVEDKSKPPLYYMNIMMGHLNRSISSIIPSASDKEVGKVLFSILQHFGKNKNDKSYTIEFKDCLLTLTMSKDPDFPIQLHIRKQ